MAIIKDNGIKCLGQFDGVIVYIKSAINKMFIDGEKKEVVTGICFKDLDGNILYEQNNYNSYICLLESDSRYFNLNDIIDELALYVQHCKIEKYFKDIIIIRLINSHCNINIYILNNFFYIFFYIFYFFFALLSFFSFYF